MKLLGVTMQKRQKKYLVTNVKGYNITNNNIIYGDLNSSTISSDLLNTNQNIKLKIYDDNSIVVSNNDKVYLSQKTYLQTYVSLVLI